MFSLSIFGRYDFNFSIFIQEDFLCCSKINSNCAHSCHCDATDHLLEKSASGSQVENIIRTRMHSSRMRTGRSLTVCCSLLPGGGGLPGLGGGSAWSRGSAWSGGSAWSWGVCLVRRCLPGQRGVCLVWGVSAWFWGVLRRPPVDRITDTCKNITLATTSLRPVINTNAIFRGQLSLLSGVSVLCEEPWHTFVHDSNSDQDLPSELCYVHF